MPDSAKDRLIVYIDGFNLYHGIHDAAGCELLWLDVVKLCKLLRPSSSLVQVKYFTAIVLNDPEGQARQDRYLQALAALHPGRLQIILGRYQEKPKRCRSCGSDWMSYEEKETDVNIAVHLVADVASNRADTYMLMTADSDVIPAVKMARSMNPKSTILAQFPPRRKSNALRRMMPSSRQITNERISQALLPREFTVESGARFQCPEKWLSSSSTDQDKVGHECSTNDASAQV